MAAFVLLLFSISFLPTSHGGALSGTALVNEVCHRTSDVVFCLQTLSSDRNAAAPQALAGDLANAALRLAQTKAALTQNLILSLLANASSASDRQLLQACEVYNRDAISQLSSANNEFNSDSIDGVVLEVNEAASAAQKCRFAEPGSELAQLSSDLVKLCEICEVSTRYFSVEDFN